MVNSANPDQAQQNVASDQGLNCLLTECSIKIMKKKLKIPPKAPKVGNGLILLIRVGKSIQLKLVNAKKDTVGSEIFVRILFSLIALKDILVM